MRRGGVWSDWQGSEVASNCHSLARFAEPREMRQLTRQFATELGVAVEDMEVRCLGVVGGERLHVGIDTSGGTEREYSSTSSGTSSETSQSWRDDGNRHRPQTIDYDIEYRERRDGRWSEWRMAEVSSSAPSLQEAQAPRHMQQLRRHYARQQ